MSDRWFLSLLATGFAIGIVIGRMLAPASPPSPPTGIALRGDTGGNTPSTRMLSAAATPTPSQREPAAAVRESDKPLPPAGARIADHFAELSARAEAGDAAAARRLADDLAACEQRADSLARAEVTLDIAALNDRAHDAQLLANLERRLETHRRDEVRCVGIESLPGNSSHWMAQAARNGDAEALLCHGMFPSDWYPPLSPDWLAHAERAQVNAVDYARRAYAAGLPEAAAMLSRMHQPNDGTAISYVTGRGGADPYWALAYAEVAAATLPGSPGARWRHNAAELAGALPAERVAQARAWAQLQRERINFRALPAPAGDTPTLCALLRRMAGI